MWLAALPLVLAEASADVAMDTGGGCAPVTVSDTLPHAGQERVPVDARLVALLTDGCDAVATWTLSLSRAGGDEVASATVAVAELGPDGVLALTPDAELTPNSDYVFRVTPEGSGQSVEVGFRTGDRRVAGPMGVPVTTLDAARWYDAGTSEAQGRVRLAEDPDALSFVVVSLAGEAGVAQLPEGARAVPFVVSGASPDQPAEVCVDARQVDGRGESVAAERVCQAPDVITEDEQVHGHGCSALGGEAGAFAVLLALLAIGRRR